MNYIAHIRSVDKQIQTVRDHLLEVGKASQQFGAKIGAACLARIAGLLHDAGKNTKEFETYIKQAVFEPDNPPPRGKVDHSTFGGQMVNELGLAILGKGNKEQLAIEWVANCIFSHHQGLRDYVNVDSNLPYWERIHKALSNAKEAREATLRQLADEVDWPSLLREAAQEAERLFAEIIRDKLGAISISLVQKYLFSCLIDADRMNTRQFEEGERAKHTEMTEAQRRDFFEHSYQLLMAHLHSLNAQQIEGEKAAAIQALRAKMSLQCEEAAMDELSLRTLSIPTGGGKTLASFRFALRHALEFGKERIIYIVPFTTIIEQNAEEIRSILNKSLYVVEHHSNVFDTDLPEDEEHWPQYQSMKLARDNWDAPIIFTTMVQFLNVFYTKGTRNVRRLHNLANAVLIFDEVQAVPSHCLALFNAATRFLQSICRSTIVLCTATQPALDTIRIHLPLSPQAEIIQQIEEVSQQFKRVQLVDRTQEGSMDAETLRQFVLKQMEQVDSVLVILNTKSAVRKLYMQLCQDSGHFYLFHLSTGMCAAHRKAKLKEMIERLNRGERVVCISTQLIEAGVNISFACVVRSLAGMDAIAQAAGRCNRHGKDSLRYVFIVQAEDEQLSRLLEIRTGAQVTRRLLHEFKKEPTRFGDDLFSPAAMRWYFTYYYAQMKEELEYPIPQLRQNMVQLLGLNQDNVSAYFNKTRKPVPTVNRQAMDTAARYFEAIRQPTTAVLVPYNETARQLILDLNGELNASELGLLLRQMQSYIVQIYKHELHKLEKNGSLYPLYNGQVWALTETAYSDEFGLEVEGEGGWDAVIV